MKRRLLFVWCLVAASACGAVTLTEDFSASPLQNGWQIFGDTNLFRWDPTNQDLDVTWDSSQPNSYFYHPLGTILAKSDAFSVEFDLQITDIIGDSPQIAVGLFNLASATNTNFSRPTATTPNLFEFDYFADNGIGQPSIVATLADTNVSTTNQRDFYFVYDNLSLNPGVTYHILMTHIAGATSLTGQVYLNGQIYSSLPNVFSGPITDFRLDTLAVSSYSSGSTATPAHGSVDNFIITLPPPPIQNLSGTFSSGAWQARFTGQTNWFYTLQRTADFQSWTKVAAASISAGTNGVLVDTNFPGDRAFYRVQAARP